MKSQNPRFALALLLLVVPACSEEGGSGSGSTSRAGFLSAQDLVGDWVIDEATRTVRLSGKSTTLPPKPQLFSIKEFDGAFTLTLNGECPVQLVPSGGVSVVTATGTEKCPEGQTPEVAITEFSLTLTGEPLQLGVRLAGVVSEKSRMFTPGSLVTLEGEAHPAVEAAKEED